MDSNIAHSKEFKQFYSTYSTVPASLRRPMFENARNVLDVCLNTESILLSWKKLLDDAMEEVKIWLNSLTLRPQRPAAQYSICLQVLVGQYLFTPSTKSSRVCSPVIVEYVEHRSVIVDDK
jgi:hypothetical protein